MTLDALVSLGSLTEETREFVELCVLAEKNMIVDSNGEILMRPIGPAADGAFPITSVNRSPPL